MKTTLDIATNAPSSADLASMPTGTAISRGNRWHRRMARLLLGGIALQIFFAGLGVFGVTDFLPHAILGSLVIGGSLALPIIAWRGHLARAVTRLSWLLMGLMLLQGLLIDLGRVSHIISALHPVNAMLLVLVTYRLAFRRL
jgi:hypothetical protein